MADDRFQWAVQVTWGAWGVKRLQCFICSAVADAEGVLVSANYTKLSRALNLPCPSLPSVA